MPYDLWDDELNRWRFPLRLDELLGPTTPHTLPEDLDREELWTLHSDELAEALDMDVVELLGS